MPTSAKLYNNQKYSDITLEFQSGLFVYANRCILAVHSTFFENLFFSNSPSTTMFSNFKFEDQDIPEETLLAVIQFFYTDDVTITNDNVSLLRSAALKYEISTLEEMCEEFFSQTLTLDNVFTFLEKAENNEMPKLTFSCLSFVCKKAKTIFSTDLHFRLSKNTLILLLQREDLHLREIDLFQGTIRWCYHQFPNDKQAATALIQELTMFVRFELISMKDLMTEVFPICRIPVEERLNILERQVVKNGGMTKSTRGVSMVEFVIKKDIKFQELLDEGWKVIYRHNYSHSTTFAELMSLKEKYSANSDALICCLGKKTQSDEVILAAFGTLKDVLTPTDSKSVAVKQGEVYWYFVRSDSFGFADEAHISLGSADTVSGEKRLSWHLSGGGGYRLGLDTSLNGSDLFEKVLLVLE